MPGDKHTLKDHKSLHWWSSPRQLLRAILMLDDTAHSIALGTAVGMFIGLTPTIGIQMLLVLIFQILVSPLFRFNRTAGLAAVYLSNPITAVPLYWFNYKVGTLFVAGNATFDEFARLFAYQGFWEWWDAVVTLLVDVGPPLIVGSLVVATVAGAMTYPAMLWLVRTIQRPKPPRREPDAKPVVAASAK